MNTVSELPDLSKFQKADTGARVAIPSRAKKPFPAEKLPTPLGWTILVEMLQPKAQSDGGVFLPDESIDAQEYLRYTGKVISMGPLCFKGERFGGSEPWCNVGDWITFGAHSGQTIKTTDERIFRLVSDDNVKCVIPDPSILKIYV